MPNETAAPTRAEHDVADEAVLDLQNSETYFDQVRQIIPTGFTSMGRQRDRGIAFASSMAGRLRDIDDNEYVDLTLGLGPVVIGHGEPEVVDALHRQVDEALSLGGESAHVLDVAERLRRWIPCADHVLFTNTGSEAVQVALRLARAATGRSKIVKFEGHYHGWLDPVYSNNAGSPPGDPASARVPVLPTSQGQVPAADSMVVTRWNDIDALRATLAAHPGEIAAVIMEPVPLNFGSYLSGATYLSEVRELCTEHGTMLIFDEVVSGFRLARGGVQEIAGVTPDLGVFAKAIGGGLPLAMVAGTTQAMRPVIDGTVGHVGTYNANPVSMAAANAVTRVIEGLPDFYETLESHGARLQRDIEAVARECGAPLTVNRVGSVLQLLWGVRGDGRSYRSCVTTERAPMALLSEELATRGVYAHPRGIIFLAYRHTAEDLDHVARAMAQAVPRAMG